MPIKLRFIQAPPVPVDQTVELVIIGPQTILEIAPCLAEPGFRLLDAGQLYELFLAIISGQFSIPLSPFNAALVITEPGNIVVPNGINFLPIRQEVPEAITITLPYPVVQGYSVLIKDSLGVCFANPFTINTSDGTLIDLLPTFVMQTAFQGQQFVFDGIGWGVIG